MFSTEQLKELLSCLPDPAFVITRSGRYAAIYGGADSRYYHDGSSLVGKYLREVLAEEKAAWFLNEIEKAIDEGGLRIVEYGLAGSDVLGLDDVGPPGIIWFEGRVTKLNFPVGGEEAVLWVASSITARHELEQRLRALSETDELTGLWNRRYFDRIASHERERAIRYHHPVSLMLLDVDHFKAVNDAHGHIVGDAVLAELSSTISGSVRATDSLARWGGEEFILLMPETELHSAAKVAEAMRRKIDEHVFEQGLRITISIGVADWRIEEETMDQVISRADNALYLAKKGGRNRVVLAAESGPVGR